MRISSAAIKQKTYKDSSGGYFRINCQPIKISLQFWLSLLRVLAILVFPLFSNSMHWLSHLTSFVSLLGRFYIVAGAWVVQYESVSGKIDDGEHRG